MKYHAMPLVSGKHYYKNNVKFDYIEPKAFKDIFNKTDAKVIGYIRLKETNKDTNDVMVITSNGQTCQYKIEHDVPSHIIGYILVSNDTYVAVKKGRSLWPIVLCAVGACVIALLMLWETITGIIPSTSTHIIKSQTFSETISVNN